MAPKINLQIVPSIPALVLECHHGSLGIARSLGRIGVRVYGVDRDIENPAFKSKYFQRAYQWDLLGQPAEKSVRFLLQIGQEIGPTALLIPTSDETTFFVAQNASALARQFVFARQSPELIKQLANKRETYHLAKRLGVPVAETTFPSNIDDVRSFSELAEFPVMLKGIDGRKLFIRTGYKMKILSTKEELIDNYETMEDPDEPNLMLQEYIPGGDDTIWIFNGYFDKSGVCRVAFVGRKIRQTPPYVGSTSLGVCEPNEVISDMTRNFMKQIGYTGILDIGYRYDARDGSYKLLDPNPRIGSTFRLFVGDNGMDVARYLYMDMTDQPLPETKPCNGRKWFVEEADLASFVIYKRNGDLKFSEWVKSFRGVKEAAWFAWDDFRPFLPITGRIILKAIRVLWRSTLLAAP